FRSILFHTYEHGTALLGQAVDCPHRCAGGYFLQQYEIALNGSDVPGKISILRTFPGIMPHHTGLSGEIGTDISRTLHHEGGHAQVWVPVLQGSRPDDNHG